MGSSRIRQRDVAEIVSQFRTGVRPAALARTYGVSRQAITYHLRRNGIAAAPARVLDEAEKEKIVAAWIGGRTIESLSEIHHCSRSAVRDVLHDCLDIGSTRVRRVAAVAPPTQERDLAYLAAIIDAEGCISHVIKTRHQWQVTVTNTSEPLKDWLTQWGGSFYDVKPVPSSNGSGMRKPVWVWKVGAAIDVLVLLRAIRPFLIIKVDKAEAAIDGILERFGDPTQPV